MGIRRITLCLLLAAAFAAAQDKPATLAVSGAVKQPLSLTAADLAAMPRGTAAVNHHGTTTAYEGVWLQDVLKKAGVPFGEELRGKALTTYVLATASDGYQVVFSLAELDPDTTGTQVLLADKSGGKPLPGEDGSFRLILPSDKRPARSIRLLTKIELVQLRK
jgi:DMSO/TMAO reductase YedYZ molybdopterin-dependent catalytic subunit